MVNDKKVQLRKKILTLLRNQKEEERLTKSLAIKNKLFGMHEFQQARTILFYASFDGEVDTFEMMKGTLRSKKKVALPTVNADNSAIIPRFLQSLDEFTKGPYGISEPQQIAPEAKADDIDLIIVPGVAFDKNNNRLGRGGGYYDRFLAALPGDISSVGLAFDFQMIDTLPCQEPHDKPVDSVLTN